MLQSYHQNAEQFEIMFNKTKYDALPDKMKAIIDIRGGGRLGRHVVEGDRPLLEGLHRAADQGQGQVLQDAGLDPAASSSRSATQIAAKKSAENPLFKEIAESQKAFAERTVKWDLDTNVSRRMAYNHYFAKKALDGLPRPDHRGWPAVRSPHRTASGCASSCCPRDADESANASHPRDRPDQHWSGKAFAWLIVALTFVVSHRGLQALHPERPDGVDLRLEQHAVRHAVHDVRRLHAGAGRPRARATSSTST